MSESMEEYYKQMIKMIADLPEGQWIRSGLECENDVVIWIGTGRRDGDDNFESTLIIGDTVFHWDEILHTADNSLLDLMLSFEHVPFIKDPDAEEIVDQCRKMPVGRSLMVYGYNGDPAISVFLTKDKDDSVSMNAQNNVAETIRFGSFSKRVHHRADQKCISCDPEDPSENGLLNQLEELKTWNQ